MLFFPNAIDIAVQNGTKTQPFANLRVSFCVIWDCISPSPSPYRASFVPDKYSFFAPPPRRGGGGAREPIFLVCVRVGMVLGG